MHKVDKEKLYDYYVRRKMSYNEIMKELSKDGIETSITSLSTIARDMGISRSASEARRNWDDRCLDYDKSYISLEMDESIDGFLLGDGCIHHDSKNLNNQVARLQFGLEHKEFAEYFSNIFKQYDISFSRRRSNKSDYIFQGQSKSHPDLYHYYNRWYLNKSLKKQPPDDVIISPKSVMMWYLGDGSCVKDRNTIMIRFSTDGFLPERVEFLASKLRDIGIACHRNNDNRIYVEVKGIPAFFNFIGKQSPINCYSYKFDMPEWRFEAKRMKEVSDELGIDYNKLSYWVKSGKVPCFRISDKGRPRFLTEHVDIIKDLIVKEKVSENEILKDIFYELNIDPIESSVDIADFVLDSISVGVKINYTDNVVDKRGDNSIANEQKILTDKAKEMGVKLIHIFEHQYIDRKYQILNYLRSSLGLNENKIYARKCRVSFDECPDFHDVNHIQGADRKALKYINLVYDGEVVGSMTAGKHHEKGGDGSACVLTRLTFKDNVTVIGGSKRLFNYFCEWAQKKGYTKIISWSDNSISQGRVYEHLGFYLADEHAPGYFYYDSKNGKYCSRQSRRKSNKNRPKGMTIAEWNVLQGFYRIWDCGKKKWVHVLNEQEQSLTDYEQEIISIIKDNLREDIRNKQYQNSGKYSGFCYVASEAFYYFMGGKESIYSSRRMMVNGIPHWFLVNKSGAVIDITREQFDFKLDYSSAKAFTFRCSKPSKRASLLLSRIRENTKE